MNQTLEKTEQLAAIESAASKSVAHAGLTKRQDAQSSVEFLQSLGIDARLKKRMARSAPSKSEIDDFCASFEVMLPAFVALSAQLQAYVMNDKASIEGFLSHHRKIINLLREAPKHISEFYPNAKLYLDLQRGERTQTGEELLLSIETDMEPREAVLNLREFRSHWWIEASKEVRDKIYITLEYL